MLSGDAQQEPPAGAALRNSTPPLPLFVDRWIDHISVLKLAGNWINHHKSGFCLLRNGPK
jgi:hypothetical protein